MRHCGSVAPGRCESVAFCIALLIGCFIGGVVGWPLLLAVGRPLWAGRCGLVAVGRWLCVGRFASVAVGRLLLVGRSGSVAVGQLLQQLVPLLRALSVDRCVNWSLLIGRSVLVGHFHLICRLMWFF